MHCIFNNSLSIGIRYCDRNPNSGQFYVSKRDNKTYVYIILFQIHLICCPFFSCMNKRFNECFDVIEPIFPVQQCMHDPILIFNAFQTEDSKNF